MGELEGVGLGLDMGSAISSVSLCLWRLFCSVRRSRTASKSASGGRKGRTKRRRFCKCAVSGAGCGTWASLLLLGLVFRLVGEFDFSEVFLRESGVHADGSEFASNDGGGVGSEVGCEPAELDHELCGEP